MTVGYKVGVFGNAGDSTSTGGVLSGDFYEKTIPLTDATLDFMDATKLKFKSRVSLEGGQSSRTRTDTADKEITLDSSTGLKIITTPFGVGVDFTCSYDSAFDVSSTAFTVQDISITGAFSGNGDLTDSMSMVAGTGSDIVLGNDVKVATTWSLAVGNTSFYYKGCTVAQGTKTVKLIDTGCRSSTLNVEHVSNTDAQKIEMKYKSFMIDGETGSEQTVTCKIQICSGTSNCVRNGVTESCPSTPPLAYAFVL